jgi:hypothetical protein
MKDSVMKHALRLALLRTVALAIAPGCATLAQSSQTYDPAQLPAFHGKVLQYDLAARGDVDGVILDNGMEVHTSPRRATEVVAAVRPGDRVTIHGLKARELSLVRARSLTNDASSITVVDSGDEEHDDDHGRGARGRHRGHRGGPRRAPAAPAQVQGQIKMQLHDPDGDLDGVLFTDGTIVHLPPQTATAMAAKLAAGQTLFVQGEVIASDLGKVVDARALGPAADQLAPLPDNHER